MRHSVIAIVATSFLWIMVAPVFASNESCAQILAELQRQIYQGTSRRMQSEIEPVVKLVEKCRLTVCSATLAVVAGSGLLHICR